MSRTTAPTGGGEAGDDPFLQIWPQGKKQRKMGSWSVSAEWIIAPAT